jgi:hypothetical protein
LITVCCLVFFLKGKLNSYDKRLEAISGYPGNIGRIGSVSHSTFHCTYVCILLSSYKYTCILGTAVVTLDKAALWTDGRTFQKAIDNVDCGWTVYKRGTLSHEELA